MYVCARERERRKREKTTGKQKPEHVRFYLVGMGTFSLSILQISRNIEEHKTRIITFDHLCFTFYIILLLLVCLLACVLTLSCLWCKKMGQEYSRTIEPRGIYVSFYSDKSWYGGHKSRVECRFYTFFEQENNTKNHYLSTELIN